MNNKNLLQHSGNLNVSSFHLVLQMWFKILSTLIKAILINHSESFYPSSILNSVLKVTNVIQTYKSGNKSLTVLDSINFSIEKGSITAIVGPSGAGKTTISALVPRLYDVTGGSIEVDGIDIRDLTLDSLRSNIGVVTQDAHLFHESIADNLRYAKHERRFFNRYFYTWYL